MSAQWVAPPTLTSPSTSPGHTVVRTVTSLPSSRTYLRVDTSQLEPWTLKAPTTPTR